MKSLKGRVEYRIAGKNDMVYGGGTVGPDGFYHGFVRLKLGKTEFCLNNETLRKNPKLRELSDKMWALNPGNIVWAKLLTVRLKDYKVRQWWMSDDMWELTKKR